MQHIWNFAIGATTAIVVFAGFLGVIAGGIIVIDRLIMEILSRRDMIPAVFEFLMERSRKKHEKKEAQNK